MSFLRFFRDERDDEISKDMETASRIVNFSQHPYYAEFMDWLEQESFKAIEVNEEIGRAHV